MDSATAMMAMMTYGFEFVLMAAISILTIVGMWKIMVKAGYNGWESLIPFYNRFILYKIAGKQKLFWVELALCIGTIFVSVAFFGSCAGIVFSAIESGYSGDFETALLGSLGILAVCSIVSTVITAGLFVVRVLMHIALADSFGLGTGYMIGLILLPYVFYAIIGFSKTINYICPGGNKNKNNQNRNYQNGNYGNQYYPNQNYMNPNYTNQNYQDQYNNSQNSYGQYNNGQNNGGQGNV